MLEHKEVKIEVSALTGEYFTDAAQLEKTDFHTAVPYSENDSTEPTWNSMLDF